MSKRQRPPKPTASPAVAAPQTPQYSTFYDADPDTEPLPPITISCAACERIVGDSSAFVGASRELQAVTLESVVSVETESGLVTCEEGMWDEFCNYKKLVCGKCGHELGKQYFATTSKLASLERKYTLSIPALSFYHHGSSTPSLPVAASNEILSLIRPQPDEMAEKMSQVMMLCCLLREEQEGVMRALQRISEQTGVDVSADEEGVREEKKDEGLRGKIEELVKAVERLKEEFVVKSELEALKEEVGERSRGNSRGTSRGTGRETTRPTESEAETHEEGETEEEAEEEEEEEEEDQNPVVEELEIGDADEDYAEEVRALPRKRRRGNQPHVVVNLAKSPEIPDSQPHRGQNIGRRASGRTSRQLK